MKRNKYFGWRIACLTALLMCLGATRSLAQDFPTQGFISEIYVDSRALSTQSVDMEKEGYTLDKDVKVDLNKGVSGSDYVYVGYKRTDNPLEAITDIIVVYCTDGSYSGENKKTVRYNGRTYYPAKYGEKSKGGNLNRGKSGSPDLYFYYTKDRSAAGIVEGDEVVTKLMVQYDGKELRDDKYAKMWYSEDNVQPNGDLNKGAGGKYIYLSMDKHKHKRYKAGVAGAWECGCGFTLDETETPSKSEDGYYNINNYAQFLWFCDFVNGVNEDAKTATPDERMRASARLLADIDLAEAEKAYLRNRFRPIGSAPDPERYDGYSIWGGTLDGCSHVIKNLTLDDSVLGDLNVAGLVGRATTGCVVKNLTLENVKISSTDKPRTLAGIIACVDGTSNVVIDNCRITGKIESSNGSDLCTAGIACICPESRGRTIVISNCTNCADVKGSRASGILGGVGIEDYSTEINNCINHGTIESTSTNEAIAFAGVYAYSIKNCLNTGKLITNGENVGYFGLRSRILSHNLSLTPCSLLMDYTGNYESTPNYVVNADSESKATKVTEDQLLSGEICYLLNDNQSAEGKVVWYQTLGTDKYPYPAKGGDIVYHYTECDGQGKYTNYGMFAEDVDHRNHELPYNLEGNGEFGKDEIWFTYLHCTICDKLIQMSNLILKYHKTVLEPSCMADGLEEFCYVTPATSREYFGYRKLEKGNKSQHNPKIAEGYTYCLDCHELLDFDEDFYRSKKVKNGVLFEISNVYDLLVYNYLHRNERISALLGYDAKLMNDIEMNIPYQWKPMYLADHTFDGDGHTISGFYCAEESAGFFYSVENSTVKNLTLEGTVHAKQGALLCVKSNDGTIIENCTTQGLVNNQNGAAGICLTADGTNIVGCRNDAEVRSTAGIAGGIVASTERGGNVNTISRTANYGPVFGKTDAAGLIATNTGNYLVSNCANYGPIEGYNKVGGLFAEVNPGNSSAGVCDTRFCISVGQTRILGPSNSKGAVVGLVNLSGGDKAHQMEVYYTHSQIGIGYVQNGLAPQSNITKTSDETFATGEICIRLNEANSLYSKESEHIDGRPIWGQKLGVDTYPSLFSDNEILYKVEANNSEFFVYENQVLPELTLQDKYYFHSPTTFSVQDITYDRSDMKIKKDFYATLYLPFAFQDPDLKVMEFDHYDAQTGDVYLNEVEQTSIEADKPYLVRLSDDCTLTEKPLVIKAQNAKISPSHDIFPRDYDDIEGLTTGFYGTYAQKSVWGEANFYCISTKYGDFRKAAKDENDGTRVYPFRSVFKLDGGVTAPAKVSIIALDDTETETGIREYHFVENNRGTIYNLNGLPVGESRSSLKPGIYVQGGKKIVIR